MLQAFEEKQWQNVILYGTSFQVLLCIHKGMCLAGIDGISQKGARLALIVHLRLALHLGRLSSFFNLSTLDFPETLF